MTFRPKSKPGKEQADEDSGKGGGFTFVDRSGKVHHKTSPRKSESAEADLPLRRNAHAPVPRPVRPHSDMPDAPHMREERYGKAVRPAQSKLPVPGVKARKSFDDRDSEKRDFGKGFKGKGSKFGKRPPFEKREGGGGGFPKRGRGENRNEGRFGKKFEGKKVSSRPPRGREKKRDRDRSPERPLAEGKTRLQVGMRTTATGEQSGTQYKATVDKNRKGFGFLIFENRTLEDAFIPPHDADGFFHGDRVEVCVNSSDQVVGIRVIAHRFREVVGRYTAHPVDPTRGGWVVYEQKRAREEIFIPEVNSAFKSKLEDGDWIRVKLSFHESGPHAVTGEIADHYGKELPPSADVGMIAAEFNLIEEHSPASEAEAREKKLEVPGADLKDREDLREVPFITIDGETARDFDDAIYVEREGSGYILWVAIADVSHYVTHGEALDQDARSRGTSVYFPERAFHMLPRALSENLCSLKPNEPRLTMVAKMHFDAAGTIQATELMEAVIQSKRRATYNEIQAEWEANAKNKNWEYTAHFELYKALRKMRSSRGSIDFDLPEAELKVKPTGEVISIKERARIEAHRLIEEFMIAANEAVTEWALARNWPFVYRIHEEPSNDALEKFKKLAATVGIQVDVSDPSPAMMAEVVTMIEGHPAQTMLNMALLRSMKQAVYSSVHGGHFGLASQAYTHFTSPIRRYPDLVVHRMLRRALRTEKKLLNPLSASDRSGLEKELQDVTEHCSYRERLASDAERESIKLKQVRAIQPHLEEEFDAKIVGMIEPGMFVKLEDPFCEGMLAKDLMLDDSYQFNEERMVFYGRRKKRTFQIGDTVKVRVIKADVERRQIDFCLADADISLERITEAQKEAREPRPVPVFEADAGRGKSQSGYPRADERDRGSRGDSRPSAGGFKKKKSKDHKKKRGR